MNELVIQIYAVLDKSYKELKQKSITYNDLSKSINELSSNMAWSGNKEVSGFVRNYLYKKMDMEMKSLPIKQNCNYTLDKEEKEPMYCIAYDATGELIAFNKNDIDKVVVANGYIQPSIVKTGISFKDAMNYIAKFNMEAK